MLVGVIQASAGVLRLGKFVRLIPHPVMMGFVNGLAIVIFLSQLELFKNNIDGKEQWLAGGELLIMLGLVALTMGIMHFLPKIAPKFPAALTAIIVVAGLTIFGGIDVNTVGSFIRDGGGTGLEGSLPQFQPQIFLLWHTLEGHWGLIISTACLLAAVGLIESLMTLNLVDDMTETRGSGNKECVAQGAANFLNGLFGGMGGCAMIGQSIINVNSGGRGRLSGLTAAIGLLSLCIVRRALDRADPARFVGRGDVYGSHRHLRLEQLQNHQQGPRLRLFCHVRGLRRYRLAGLGDRSNYGCHHFGLGLCLEKCHHDPRPQAL